MLWFCVYRIVNEPVCFWSDDLHCLCSPGECRSYQQTRAAILHIPTVSEKSWSVEMTNTCSTFQLLLTVPLFTHKTLYPLRNFNILHYVSHIYLHSWIMLIHVSFLSVNLLETFKWHLSGLFYLWFLSAFLCFNISSVPEKHSNWSFWTSIVCKLTGTPG